MGLEPLCGFVCAKRPKDETYIDLKFQKRIPQSDNDRY